MQKLKPVSLLNQLFSAILIVIMAVPQMVMAEALSRLTIVRVNGPTDDPPGDSLTFKLELQCSSNGVAYLIQSCTNLTSTNGAGWTTVLAVKADPGRVVSVPITKPPDQAAFYRVAEFLALTDTNAPAWSNSPGGRFNLVQASNLLARWNAATDNVGVASYRLFLGTNLVKTVSGNTLSCLLPINPRQRADIRVQAVDAFDNATELLSLTYLPGDKLLAIGDDSGRLFLSQIQPDGSFSSLRQIANFGSPDWGGGFGDFDRDGFLDLISGHGGNNTMTPYFFKGLGDGTFAVPVPLPTSPGANNYLMGATVADFDCDGSLDFVVNGNERFIYFYWGRGDGTFVLDRRDWGAFGQYGRAMTAGDFNEDGRDDLARASCCNGEVRLFLSTGDRTFYATNLIGNVGDAPYTTVAGDFDEDGHLDLIANAGQNGDVTFFKGLGDGTFTNLGVNGVRANLDLNNFAAMSAYDYNGDGHLDLVLVNYTGHGAFFFAGNGDGTFSANPVTLTTGLGNALGVTSPPLPPRVNVAISPTDPVTNLNRSLPFQAVGSGVSSNDLFRWTFGDQSTNPLAWSFNSEFTNNGRTVSHIYTNEGRFVTRLLHTATNGINSARGTWVTITGQPPHADPGGPYSFGEQAAVQSVWTATLDGSASSDDSGITNYFWTFGDGSSLNNGPIVTHSWSNAGLWNLSLMVTDTVGQSNSNHTTVTFTPGAPPVASIHGPDTLDESFATDGRWRAIFYGTNSTDDHGIWRFDWNFGNGTTGSGSAAEGEFTVPGNYDVTLTVTDHAGQTNAVTHGLKVRTDAPPVAVITGPSIVDETSASNGIWRATFSGAGSTDNRGIWKYDWNFGNGTTGSGSPAVGAFTAAGNYNLILTVTDHAGQTASTNFSVEVKANGFPTPVITGPRLVTEATATNHQWFATWNGLPSADDRGIYRYDWNFGDGTTGTGATITHAYPSNGLYQLVLTVTDFGNQTSTTTQNVAVIAGTLPQPRISATTTNPEGAQPITIGGLSTTDDRGIASFRWTLPPRKFVFDGQFLDKSLWFTANARQDEKLVVSGNGNWGQSYFFTPNIRLRRGGFIEGRVDTSSGTSYAMVGLKNLNNSSGQYGELSYAIYFNDGALNIYEAGNHRGQVTNYTRGSSYDFRIEIKSGAGARYFFRPSDQEQPFVMIFETSNYSDATLGFGADVHSGSFGFDDLTVDGLNISTWEFTTAFSPGGPVTLEVVDHAGQTNSASLLVNPIIGSPPVALITGPTNAPAGVELAFHGYLSTDDHGIASYTWDFGDDSPTVFGPAVSHAYNNTPGIYTNTLTVHDFAGQSGVASVLVFIGSGNQITCVPWRIIGGVEFPHETYAGRAITLKAVARGVPVPFDYIWEFGDGSPSVTNTVSTSAGAYGLQATHAYFAADGTPYNATVRIALTNGTVLIDNYPILIRPRTLDTEMNIAIDEGLWYLHKSQERYDIDAANKGGRWSQSGYYANATASAVQAFGVNGHSASDDASQDPYVETVQRGLNCTLTLLTPYSIGPQTFGDPDGNHNGIGLSVASGAPIYETGPVMDGLVAAVQPELVAPVGGGMVKGRTYRDIMQDMVDQYSWGQSEASWGGGWRYGWNGDSDNSACQWAAIGLMAAERYWGIAAPKWVKEQNLVWLNYSCCFGYGGGGDGIATTPSGMVQLAYLGVPLTNYLWQTAESRVASRWGSTMAGNNLYAHYAIAKALRGTLPQPVHNLSTGKDWFLDPTDGLARTTVNQQRGDGSWLSSDGHVNQPAMATAWSINILSSSIFQRGPIAVIQARPNPTAVGFPVVFDGRNSNHRHPAFKVIEWRWDFDASNGLDFDHPDAFGPIVTNRFGFFGTNVVYLQVRDNSTPQLNDVASVEVRTTLPPYPPTADAGGPYVVCVKQDVHLDGAGSFDVDAAQGDYIQSWQWEVDGNVPYFNDGVTGVHAVITNGYALAGQYNVGLLVKDATSIVFPTLGKPDMTNANFTTVYVYNRVITNLFGRAKDNKIQLVWNPAGDYAAIHRSTAGPDRGFAEIGRTTSTYATFLDTNVDYNVPYFYRVSAFQNGQAAPLGISDSVNVVSVPRSFENCGPYFTATPPHEAVLGQLYEVYLQAKERQNNPFSYVILAGPTNMTLNATNGLLRFQPTSGQLGEHLVSVAVTNLCGTNVLSYTLAVVNLTNLPPVAAIHGPYAGVAGLPVQFSSAGTFDPDTNALTYVWAFGDGVIDTNANPAHAYPAQGTYTVSLYVNDGHGGTATAQTHATISRANRLPIANAGRDQMPLVGQIIRLDGSSSWDADLDPLNYRWDIVMRPDGSTSSLTNDTTARPSLLIDRPGFYIVRLIVNDGQADGAPDAVTLITANSPPIANAGRDQRVLEGNTARLDGTASSDVDLNPLTYRWSLFSKPAGSVATLTNDHTAQPTFGVDVYGLYIAELIVNDGFVDSAPARVRVTTGNLVPEIVSVPTVEAVPGYPWNYRLLAYDPDGTNVTVTLVQAPPGLVLNAQPPPHNVGDTNAALLAWTPTRAQIGSYPVRVRVTDAEGATNEQSFTLNVAVDTQPPAVAVTLVLGETSQSGQWAARLGTTAQFQVLATDNVGVTNRTLLVASRPVALDANGVGSVIASNAGLWQVVATATDAEGNVGVTNTTILFYDPEATNTIFAQILSPTNSQNITRPVPVIGTITNATDLLSYRVDFARAADVDLGSIAIEGPQFTTLTNVLLPPGTRSITNKTLALFDPTLLLNDDYIIRVVASDGQSLWYEPALVSVSGNLKFGEFHLDFTDLTVPVAGIPITVTRSYDTREAGRQEDFGLGWNLGVQNAGIRKTLRDGTLFLGSRVYINTPDGRRVGFTAGYQPSSFLFSWLGNVVLQPDAGVYEKLDIEGNSVVFAGGAFYGGLGDENFNPSTFRLTTKDGTIYTYHDTLGLQNVQDLNGNRLVLTRDGIYHFAAGSTNYDQAVPFIRDAQGRIAEIVDPSGNRLTYSYDAKGDLRSFTDSLSNVTQYLYSNSRAHYLTNIIDSLGRSALRMEYDASGRLLAVTDALGHRLNQDFDANSRTATFKDGNGNTLLSRYDENGNELVRGIVGVTTNYFAYDANNNLLASTNGRGFATNYNYDARGNVTSIRDSLGNSTTIAYNDQSKPVGVTNALGQILSFSYDSAGKLLEVVNNAGLKTTVTRDSQGRVASLTDAAGHTTQFDYTGGCACGKPGKVINPDGSFKLTEYDSLGNTTRTVNELGAETLSSYDSAGKLLWTRDPLSNYTRFFYNGPLLTNVVDALGRSTRYEYDALNRTNAIIDAEGGIKRFAYDGNGNRTNVTDSVSNVTTFVYDAANRLIQQIDPLGHTNFFAYDAAGNRTEATDRNGRRRTFAYDAANRMTNELWWEGTNVVRSIVFGFNELGVQTLAADPAARYEYRYDTLNRLGQVLAQSAGVPDFTLLYTYTALGQVESVTDQWGVRVGSSYDNRNRLASRTWSSTLPGGGVDPARVDFAYDLSGNRVRTDRFSDLAGANRIGFTTNAYNRAGIVTNITHLGPASLVLAKYDYNFDAAFQITRWAIGNHLSDFAYDRTGQLTNALNTAQPNENFRFDANGNRVGAQSGGSYVVGRNNQVLSDGTNRYAYDFEGNMTLRSNTVTGARTTYQWDHRNRLLSVLDYNPGGVVTQTVAFVYDAMNRRLAKTVNGQTTRFLYNGDDSWADLDGSNAVTSRYLHGARIDELLARQRASDGRGWYLTDHLGTVRDIANAAGAVVAHVDYSSFGQVLGVSNPVAVDRFMFTGRELDAETGLYFYRARYFSAQLGRFTSSDPVGFSSGDYNLNRYSQNEPNNRRDPFGLSPLIESSINIFALNARVVAAQEATRIAILKVIITIEICLFGLIGVSDDGITFAEGSSIAGTCLGSLILL